METIFMKVAKEKGIRLSQVESSMKLLDEGATVPFVSRYRKEVTGNLDEVQLTEILEQVQYLRNLEKRKEEVLRIIEEQGGLTEELKTAIQKAEKLQAVEDLYFPYRKKKKTKADVAIERGLEPLAEAYMTAGSWKDLEELAKDFVTEEVPRAEEALEGAELILAQRISEQPKYRERIRGILGKYGYIQAKAKRKAKELDLKHTYEDYYEYQESLAKLPAHRILAMNRGEKEGILAVSLQLEEKEERTVKALLLGYFPKKEVAEAQERIVADALSRLIFPSVEREVRNSLTEMAELEAIEVFQENLKNLLLQAPLEEKAVLALDPGYRTGCKVAIMDKHGFYQADDIFYLVEGVHHAKQLEQAKKRMLKYIKDYKIDIIVIGNGTASRETEAFVASVIREANSDVKYAIANEAGASIYSASKLAGEEFPDLDVTVRGAISIGRRMQDPLAELVKIDPKSIGVGMYQHDVNQKHLDASLEQVISSVVNAVGANLNTASWALLSHISGIKKTVAKNIVDYRKENGNFKNRKALLKVKGLGPKAYEQMAGFLVIPHGENPLDNTIIHPESYHIAEKILATLGFSLADYEKHLAEARKALEQFKVEDFAKQEGFGLETTKDVYEALRRDRRDPRDEVEKPLLKSDILNIENLSVGMKLEGTVRNVVKFGAFVDIGLKNDALLHISEIADQFVSDPSKHLAVGQIIEVRIKEIDKKRERVGLTRKKEK